MMLIWLLACAPEPAPEELVVRGLLSGQPTDTLHALARIEPTSPMVSWALLGQQITALEEERAAIHAAEQSMLLQSATSAIEAGDLAGALPALAAALEQDSPAARQRLEHLTAAAASAEPAVAAVIYSSLSEIWEHDRIRYSDFARRAALARLSMRYTPEALAGTLSAWEGVSLSAAEHLIARLDREYHTPIDWAETSRVTANQLSWFSTDPGARSVWPELTPETFAVPSAATSLETHLGQLTAATVAGEAARIPSEVIIAEWVAAMCRSLDPWTRAVWPAEIAAWQAQHGGIYYGVGLELAEKDGVVFIDRPLLDTPAWSSGIHQGDVLLTIADDRSQVSLTDHPADRRGTLAEAALQGEGGTAVRLTVQRDDENTSRTIELTRGPVKFDTLAGHHREEDNTWSRWLSQSDGLAYVRIRAFRDYTEADFDAFTEPLLDEIRGLILDLRGNPGGDVNSAVQIADRFIADGILAELSGRVEPETGPDIDPVTGQALVPWNHAVPGHGLEGVPVVVLVDSDTASAAEILAGSLQERAGAQIVGAPTWGKGLAQALRTEVERGYAVQFTNQIWTLPSGRRLDRRTDGGVRPDLVVSLSPAERFQIGLRARQRGALRVHADGHPMVWLDTVRRADLPVLSADPAMLWGELVLRAMLEVRSTSDG
ncbi:MAG: S41 family peptidase [Myxococcota bacterium]|nr:S41 family peptidase [Myxococcota bacterium]